MLEPPRVTVTGGADVLGSDEQPRTGHGLPLRLAALALAALAGFAAARVLSPPGDSSGEPGLALVAGRQPYLESSSGDEPSTSVEVTVVNTGPRTLRLVGAAVRGTGLVWDVDRTLAPGSHVSASLREERPCSGEPDAVSGRGGRQDLTVEVQDQATRDRLPDIVLALPATLGRLYDDHVRMACSLPRLPDALEVVQRAPVVEGRELVIPVDLLSRSRRDLRVLAVRTAVPGVSARLTTAAGADVPLPLAVPGRTRTQIEGTFLDETSPVPYRLRLSGDAEACAFLRSATSSSSGEDVTVELAEAQDEQTVGSRGLFVDLPDLARRTCG